MKKDKATIVGYRAVFFAFCTGLAVLAAGLVGCGGSIDIFNPRPTVKVTISWPELSRDLPQKAILAPGSARTAVIKLTGAAIGGGDFEFTVDRPTNTAKAVVKNYESAKQIVAGTYPLWIGFYTASGDVMGSLVGEVYDTVTIRGDGSGISDIAVQGKVALVEVPKGQSVAVGETKELGYTVKDEKGQLLAVDRNSVFWSVVEGDTCLNFSAGNAVGIWHGPAKAAATVDAIASNPVTVQVTPVARAIVIPLIPGTREDGINEAKAVSADGKVVVGNSETPSGDFHAFRWTEAGGTADLGVPAGYNTSRANGINLDGSVVVGVYYATGQDNSSVAFRWTASEGMKPIEGFPEGTLWSSANGVSGDGKTVVGQCEINNPDEELVGKFGFIWTAEVGVKIFGDLLGPGVPTHDCGLYAISTDGNVIVGAAAFDLDESENPIVGPVRWYKIGNVWNVTLLGPTPGTTGKGEAYAVNADGSVVGGWTVMDQMLSQPFRWTITADLTYPAYQRILVMQTCNADGSVMAGSGGDPGNAFVWDIYRGYRNFYDVLDAEGLLDDIEGRSPLGVMGLSADGQTLVGICGNGIFRAFLVDLPYVPESLSQR